MGAPTGALRAPSSVKTTITPRRGFLHLDLGELWRYRELGFFFVWRDIKVRYKQTVIGAAWAIIQPIVLMLVFTVIFGRGGRLAPPPGVPGPIYYFSALVIWSYFAQALQVSTGSVLGSQQIITRIYFPRLLLPLYGTFPGIVDFSMAFLVMVALMIGYGVPFTTHLLVMPLLVLVAGLTAFGAGMWLSATNAIYRDIREATPFLIQVLMFLSVILPAKRFAAAASSDVGWLYGLNPMAWVVEASRWAITGRGGFPTQLMVPGLVVTFGLLVTGLIYFRRIEDVIVDVV
jgi:homopolymeric O-antigen transport system permease protein